MLAMTSPRADFRNIMGIFVCIAFNNNPDVIIYKVQIKRVGSPNIRNIVNMSAESFVVRRVECCWYMYTVQPPPSYFFDSGLDNGVQCLDVSSGIDLRPCRKKWRGMTWPSLLTTPETITDVRSLLCLSQSPLILSVRALILNKVLYIQNKTDRCAWPCSVTTSTGPYGSLGYFRTSAALL